MTAHAKFNSETMNDFQLNFSHGGAADHFNFSAPIEEPILSGDTELSIILKNVSLLSASGVVGKAHEYTYSFDDLIVALAKKSTRAKNAAALEEAETAEHEAEEEANTLRAENTDLAAQVNELTNEINSLKGVAAATQTETDAAAEREAGLNTALADKQAELDAANQKIADQQTMIDSLTNNQADESSVVAQKQSEIDALNARVAELTAASDDDAGNTALVAEKQSEIDSLHTQLDTVTAERDQLQKDLEAATAPAPTADNTATDTTTTDTTTTDTSDNTTDNAATAGNDTAPVDDGSGVDDPSKPTVNAENAVDAAGNDLDINDLNAPKGSSRFKKKS